MSLPSIVSYGAPAKTSTLVWDTDLVIPDGYAIESATGDVNITGNLVISNKQLVFGQNVGNASVTIAQPQLDVLNYTSPDFPITSLVVGVQYLVPSLSYFVAAGEVITSTFTLQAKVGETYQNIAQVTVEGATSGTKATQPVVSPIGTSALRYTLSHTSETSRPSITPDVLSLKPLAVY